MASAAASDPTILSSKRAVYVGGLADEVTSQLLRAAMIPFGDIKSLDIVSISFCVQQRLFAILAFRCYGMHLLTYFSLSESNIILSSYHILADGL
jgi:RNA recognition motif-containing protein